MTEGFQISIFGLNASATGVWGMILLILFVVVMSLVYHLLPVFKRWLERTFK